METAPRGREEFKRYKSVMNFLAILVKCFPMRARRWLFAAFRNKKGKTGMAVRYILLKTIAKKIGDNVSIHENVYLLSPWNLELGNNVSVHPMSYIDAAGGIRIGDDVSIAHSVTVMSTSHIYESLDMPIKDQSVEYRKTIIENDVWIGAKSTVLFGVTIHHGSIVGANSLVNRNVEPYSIVGGVPAKTLKKRD